MKEILIMSYRETECLKVISRIEFKELTVADAAESLHISERQMYRILKRYHAEGEAGLLHRLRGRTSNVAFPKDERERALRLYRERYSDYGPTFFAEKLDEHHDIQISHQTATRWLIKAGFWSGTRKKRPHLGRHRRCFKPHLRPLRSIRRHPTCFIFLEIDEANRFLDTKFLDGYNQRFSSSYSLVDIHRSASGSDLTNIFCFEVIRHVYNDWTITWNAQFLQLLSSDVPLAPASFQSRCTAMARRFFTRFME